MDNLIHEKLYWVKSKKYNHVYLAEYDSEWSDGGMFYLFGNDEVFSLNEFEVLGSVDLVVPDYAKETRYGS